MARDSRLPPMADRQTHDITGALTALSQGTQAMDHLMPLVYRELKRIGS